VTFPNVLVLNYLKQTKQTSPEIQMRAENYIALGYQRLLTFEVPTGGFSLFGQPPASVMLSAKGLLEFADMAKVYPVDPALVDRTRRWLFTQQKPDGTWPGTAAWDHPPETPGDPLPLTAIVTWAIIESSGKNESGTSRAIGYLKENATRTEDPYVLSLIANALVADDPNDATAKNILARLDQLKAVAADTTYWTNRASSFTGATGVSGSIETTALVAYAFLRARAYPDSTQRALTFLIQKKSPNGTWGSTQATILALRALVESAAVTGEITQDATVRIAFNGAPAKPIQLNRENSGVVQFVTYDDVSRGSNRIDFQVDGKGSLAYQISSSYYLPWSSVPPSVEQAKSVDIQVNYDRTTLAVDEQVGVNVRVQLMQVGSARMTLVDLGVPPGFTVMTEDLDALVQAKKISRYELTGRQIIIYLEEFNSKQPVTFSYHLRAKFPLRAQAPLSTTFDYYNPGMTGTQPPQQLTVK
jgi:hypothetical protein